MKLAFSFGAGVNSVAIVAGFIQRGIRPDLVIFADTGSEFPETYALVWQFARRFERIGWPGLRIVHKTFQGRPEALGAWCERTNQLPGLAYGTRSCSIKFKGDLLDRELKREVAMHGWEVPVRKAIGYHAGETHRLHKVSPTPELWTEWYPLAEWGWGQQECIRQIEHMGWCIPKKSSCYFCPAHKPSEILAMRETHPDLLQQAVNIERNATKSRGRGLGISFLWGDLLDSTKASQMNLELEENNPFHPCGCMEQ